MIFNPLSILVLRSHRPVFAVCSEQDEIYTKGIWMWATSWAPTPMESGSRVATESDMSKE